MEILKDIKTEGGGISCGVPDTSNGYLELN